MKDFTASGPAVVDGERLWEDIAIGFQHTVTSDGVLTHVKDADGNLVPRVYRFPAKVTPADHVRAIRTVTQYLNDHDVTLDRIATDPEVRIPLQEDMMVRLLSAVLGDDQMWNIYEDVTVKPEQFDELLTHLMELWGWDKLLRELVPDSVPFEVGPS